MHLGLDRVAVDFGQQIAAEQPPRHFLQRVVVAFAGAAGVFGAAPLREPGQDRLQHRGAFGCQLAAQYPGAVVGEVQAQVPVLERLVRVRRCQLLDRGGRDHDQVLFFRPGRGGGHDQLIGPRPVAVVLDPGGEFPDPAGHRQGQVPA